MADFYQEAPRLGNQYDADRLLQAYLRRVLPRDVFAEVEPGLRRLGERAVTEIQALGDAAEASPPRHVPYDPWGKRIDRIEVCDAWKHLERIAVEEGIVATAYERAAGAAARVHQFARLYLYGPPSAIATCPLAMTDGAARVLELHGDDWLKTNVLPRLLARDPRQFWSSGQWMTERTGGSDISGTSTVARSAESGYRLYGTKWFTSATTSQVALTLARVEGAPEGSRGLSLFYVELRDSDGQLRDITVHRLKDKLGTRALPTAELTLAGTPARLIGGAGNGVRRIAALLNITRAYNACCAAGLLRRGLALARDYAFRRRAFGKRLADHPLHVETLAGLQVEGAAAFHLVFRTAELMGKEETGTATEAERAVLRLLTPLVKLATAKQAVAACSEVLEAFGGAGYVEDTGMPRLLRDAQVLAIWEGTTNVLSLDALRAIEKEAAFQPFLAEMDERLARMEAAPLRAAAARTRDAAHRLAVHLERSQQSGSDVLQAGARAFALSLARTYAASLLLEQAEWELRTHHDAQGTLLAQRWCEQELAPLVAADEARLAASRQLGLG